MPQNIRSVQQLDQHGRLNGEQSHSNIYTSDIISPNQQYASHKTIDSPMGKESGTAEKIKEL